MELAERYTGKKFDLFDVAEHCINSGWVQFNWKNYDDSENFYIVSPTEILNYLTNKKWVVRKQPADYVIQKDDYVIAMWAYNNKTHFVMDDYHTTQFSNCTTYGKVDSYRVFNVLGA